MSVQQCSCNNPSAGLAGGQGVQSIQNYDYSSQSAGSLVPAPGLDFGERAMGSVGPLQQISQVLTDVVKLLANVVASLVQGLVPAGFNGGSNIAGSMNNVGQIIDNPASGSSVADKIKQVGSEFLSDLFKDAGTSILEAIGFGKRKETPAEDANDSGKNSGGMKDTIKGAFGEFLSWAGGKFEGLFGL